MSIVLIHIFYRHNGSKNITENGRTHSRYTKPARFYRNVKTAVGEKFYARKFDMDPFDFRTVVDGGCFFYSLFFIPPFLFFYVNFVWVGNSSGMISSCPRLIPVAVIYFLIILFYISYFQQPTTTTTTTVSLRARNGIYHPTRRGFCSLTRTSPGVRCANRDA